MLAMIPEKGCQEIREQTLGQPAFNFTKKICKAWPTPKRRRRNKNTNASHRTSQKLRRKSKLPRVGSRKTSKAWRRRSSSLNGSAMTSPSRILQVSMCMRKPYASVGKSESPKYTTHSHGPSDLSSSTLATGGAGVEC